MTTAISWTGGLQKLYADESARIAQEFVSSGDGRAAVLRRAACLDSIVLQLWEKLFTPQTGDPENCALVAVGGFGRECLFPFSDVDLLFLFADNATEEQCKDR